MFDLAKARNNMVFQQIQPWLVSNEMLLGLMNHIPREMFCPSSFQSLAYADVEIPIGHRQSLLPPKVVARMLQALDLKKTDNVLEIGTGTGYVTALLCHLAHHVFSVECDEALCHQAQENLTRLSHHNATFHVGNGIRGWASQGPFDAIIATGAFLEPPLSLMDQLKPNGRLLAVVGKAPAMQVCLFKPKQAVDILFETVIPYLVDDKTPSSFTF